MLHALRSGHELLVAEEDGHIVAYLLSHDAPDEVHLLQIAVHPDYQRQGLATQLGHRLFADKAGRSAIYLEVRASNEPAQLLYTALGFHTVGRRAAYYPPLPSGSRREDAILMARPLEPVAEARESL